MKKIKEMKKEILTKNNTLKMIVDCSNCVKKNRKNQERLIKTIGELTKNMDDHLKDINDEDEKQLVLSMYNKQINTINDSIERYKEEEKFIIKKACNFLVEVWF